VPCNHFFFFFSFFFLLPSSTQLFIFLSALGELGSSAHGIARFLHTAEFSDPPSGQQCQALTASVAKLADRGRSPESHDRVFSGVNAVMLQGKPADGGFGVLPWREHILARHAWWGAKFVASALTAEPWILLGRAKLRSTCSWLGTLACLDCSKLDGFPKALHRMFVGMQALGKVHVSKTTQLEILEILGRTSCSLQSFRIFQLDQMRSSFQVRDLLMHPCGAMYVSAPMMPQAPGPRGLQVIPCSPPAVRIIIGNALLLNLLNYEHPYLPLH